MQSHAVAPLRTPSTTGPHPFSNRSAAAAHRYTAHATLWLSGMRVFVPAAALTLMISQTNAFTLNPVVDGIRWTLLALICVMVALRPRGRLKLRHLGLVDWFAGTFVVFALASYLYSRSPSLTLQRSIAVLLLAIAVFWSVWHYADIVSGERIARSLLAMTTVMFVAGVANYFVSDTAMLAGRFTGVFMNPNAVGMLGILFLPVAVAAYMRTRKASALIVIMLLAGSVVFSGSRNGVLAISIGLLVMLMRIRAWRAFVMLAVIATVAYLAMPDFSEAVGSAPTKGIARILTGDRIQTGGGRVEAWQAAIPIIRQKIAFGYGFGTEDLIFGGMTFRIHRGDYVHNSYLGLTYQLGLIGSLLFFLPLLGLLVVRLFKRGRIPAQTAAYEAILLGGLIACLFESWIYSAGNAFAFPFWIFVMLLIRAHGGAEDPDPPRKPRTRARFAPRPYLLAPRPAPVAPLLVDKRFDPPGTATV